MKVPQMPRMCRCIGRFRPNAGASAQSLRFYVRETAMPRRHPCGLARLRVAPHSSCATYPPWLPTIPERIELAAAAARLIAEEGCDYGPAKRRAVQELLGDPARASRCRTTRASNPKLRRYLDDCSAANATAKRLLACARLRRC